VLLHCDVTLYHALTRGFVRVVATSQHLLLQGPYTLLCDYACDVMHFDWYRGSCVCMYSAISERVPGPHCMVRLQVADGGGLRYGRYLWNLLNKQSLHQARHGPLAWSPAGRPQPLTVRNLSVLRNVTLGFGVVWGLVNRIMDHRAS
jgi:hypothetical protein